MKKAIFCFIASFITIVSFSQESTAPKVIIKWSPAGLLAGNVSLQSELNFRGKNSFTVNAGIPVAAHRTVQYNGNDVNFTMQATSLMAGYRRYLSKKNLRGFYIEPFAKYVHHTSDGINYSTLNDRPVTLHLTNMYNGVGVGAQLGAQFLISRRVVIDLFLIGPEINSSSNNFKAAEVSNNLPWTFIEANEAEKDIKDFINQYPFIKNKTAVTVDKNNRTVTADFKGALPGFRTGISIGIAL